MFGTLNVIDIMDPLQNKTLKGAVYQKRLYYTARDLRKR